MACLRTQGFRSRCPWCYFHNAINFRQGFQTYELRPSPESGMEEPDNIGSTLGIAGLPGNDPDFPFRAALPTQASGAGDLSGLGDENLGLADRGVVDKPSVKRDGALALGRGRFHGVEDALCAGCLGL